MQDVPRTPDPSGKLASLPEPDLRRRSDVESLFEHSAVPMPQALLDRARTVAHEVFQISAHSGPLRVGQQVGPYEVLSVLGAGGQAFVYEAKHLQLSRRVALKVPHGGVPERLLREARLAGRVEHPHVVRVEHVGELEDGAPYLVMELLAGGTLEDRLETNPDGLPLPEIKRIGSAILEALEHAHRQGIVHRDVKPSNVLFDLNGHPKLGDLGVGTLAAAQAELQHSVDVTGLTGNRVLGTPSYMAPEQANPTLRNGEPIDGRADLYGFGKLLYSLLTGATPTTIRPVSRIRGELDPAWDEFVFGLVEDDRDKRPATATDVRAAFAALPSPATPPPLPAAADASAGDSAATALERELALRTPDAPEGSSPIYRVGALVGQSTRPSRLLGFGALLLFLQGLALGGIDILAAWNLLPLVLEPGPTESLAVGALATAWCLALFRRSARRTPGRPGRGYALLTALPVCFFPGVLTAWRLWGSSDVLGSWGSHRTTFTEFCQVASASAVGYVVVCWLFWRVTWGRTPRDAASVTAVTPAKPAIRARPRGTWSVVARIVLGILSFLSAGAAFVFALIVISLGALAKGCGQAVGGTTSGGLSDGEEIILLWVLPIGLVLLGLLAFVSILFRRAPAEPPDPPQLPPPE